MSTDSSLGCAKMALIVCLLSSHAIVAQCQFDLRAGPPAAGPASAAYCLQALANGDLIAGGSFAVAGPTTANNVARFDGAVWSAIGDGVNGTVNAVAETANGDLIVGGNFTTAGGVATGSIARWDGVHWSALGAGTSGNVYALQVMANGDLIAGGTFSVNGAALATIARWDGAGWSAVSGGLLGQVFDMTELANGDLAVAGHVSQPGTNGANGLMRWDGAAWSVVPGLSTGVNSYVHGVAQLASGELVLCGLLSVGQTSQSLAVTSGPTMQPVPSPVGGVRRIAVAGNGDVLAAGWNYATMTSEVGRWDGANWTMLAGDLPDNVGQVIVAAAGQVLLAGRSTETQASVVGFDGVHWQPVGEAVPPNVDVVAATSSDGFAIGGAFDEVLGVAANNIALWSGAAWTGLGQGVDGRVTALSTAPDGSLLVGGEFTAAGGVPANHIARWHNGAWSTLASGLAQAPVAICASAAGEVVALIDNEPLIQFFNGQAWSTIDPVATNGWISADHRSVVAMPNGDFVFGGYYVVGFAQAYSALRLSAGSMQVIAPISGYGLELSLAADGELYGVVQIGGPNQLTRLVGNTWQPLSAMPHQVTDLQVLPGGAVLTAASAGWSEGVFRWDGGSWLPLPGLATSSCSELAINRRGELMAAGTFTMSNREVAQGFMHATPSCPATATSVGAGCTGLAGPLSLIAETMPWLGATMQMTAYGLPGQSLAVHAVGTMPIVQPLPLGAPGCSLLVSPIYLDALTPSNGQATASVLVPNSQALVGLGLRSQVVGLELSPSFAIVRTTSTNAVQMTVGTF